MDIYFLSYEKAVCECSLICKIFFLKLLFCNNKSLEKSWKKFGNVFDSKENIKINSLGSLRINIYFIYAMFKILGLFLIFLIDTFIAQGCI